VVSVLGMKSGQCLETETAAEQRAPTMGLKGACDIADRVLPQGSGDFPVFARDILRALVLAHLRLCLPHLGELGMEALLVQEFSKNGRARFARPRRWRPPR